MKTGLAKKFLAGGTAAVLSLSMVFLPLARAYATSPYFKVLGGDSLAGGWFNDTTPGTSCTTSANFQDDKFSSSNPSYGGIYTFAQSSGSNFEGASTQYAAFALGQIDGGSAPNGFFSDAATNPSVTDTLSFANINSLNPPGYNGGLWGGSVRNASQCIPDYYDTKMPKTTVALNPAGRGFGNPQASGTVVYTADGTSTPYALTKTNINIHPNADIAIFVDGDVYIDHDIKYSVGNLDKLPRFALVARGSIYVDPSVSQLDGLYIAQPPASSLNTNTTVTADTGDFWTCHDGTTSQPSSSFVAASCQKNLTVNGAVIAKQVELLRLAGDVADNNANPAEVFNYTPEILAAGPFFPTDGEINGTFTAQPVLQSLISLPPVF